MRYYFRNIEWTRILVYINGTVVNCIAGYSLICHCSLLGKSHWLYYVARGGRTLLHYLPWKRNKMDFQLATSHNFLLNNYIHYYSPYQCCNGLKRRSAAARLLGLRVRIPPGAWMAVCCECCVLSRGVLCVGLIPRPEESCRVWCDCVWSWGFDNEEVLAHWGAVAQWKGKIRYFMWRVL